MCAKICMCSLQKKCSRRNAKKLYAWEEKMTYHFSAIFVVVSPAPPSRDIRMASVLPTVMDIKQLAMLVHRV